MKLYTYVLCSLYVFILLWCGWSELYFGSSLVRQNVLRYLNLDHSVYRQINTIVGVVRFWKFKKKNLLEFRWSVFRLCVLEVELCDRTQERYTGLFKMIVRVQLSSGNSTPNSGNHHHLTNPFEGGMHSFKRQSACVSWTEGTNQNRHWNHHRWHVTDSLERNQLS